jgi:AraC family transcriptional regulator
LTPLTAVYNPAGVAHSTTIGPSGASLFTIEFRSEALHALDLRVPERILIDRGGQAMLWPGLRLYSAFKQSAEAAIVEACSLEVLAAITQFRGGEKSVPCWFGRIKERLHDGFREPLRMCNLAHEAGIHPVHFARTFRQIERCTPGEYQQRLQVRAACDLLQDPEWPLSAIAAECGFADQSHFTRIFRRHTGATPARFRVRIASHGIFAESPQTQVSQ